MQTVLRPHSAREGQFSGGVDVEAWPPERQGNKLIDELCCGRDCEVRLQCLLRLPFFEEDELILALIVFVDGMGETTRLASGSCNVLLAQLQCR